MLARRCAVALWRGEEVPAPYRMQMTALAEVMRFMAMELRNGRLPTRARERLVAKLDTPAAWGDTALALPFDGTSLRDAFTGRPAGTGESRLRLSDVLGDLPVAVFL